MARIKTQWVCQNCGFTASKFLGRCTECNSWNSLVEELQEEAAEALPIRVRPGSKVDESREVSPLSEIENNELKRYSTGFKSLDEVLGGGIVPGAVILLAGDPGIGKSTLILQMANMLAKQLKVLYVSAEESKQQIQIRAKRLGIKNSDVIIAADQNVAAIEKIVDDNEIAFAIIDSIQAVYHPEISSAPGSVSQVRENAGIIANMAKAKNIATILVGHVTKDGSIAGPRVLEHMVDVVLQFEGDKTRQLRILRTQKNRFGSTSEIAIFSMAQSGLTEVSSPSSLFLTSRSEKNEGQRAASGTAVLAAVEGMKSLLLEVESLVSTTSLAAGRRVANGVDLNRLLMLLAVLEKRNKLYLTKQDVYVNVVGGFYLDDPASDLGIAVAVATSYFNRSVDPHLVSIGEIGLTGEVRPVSAIDKRLKEAATMGFKRALIPKRNLPLETNPRNLTIIPIEYLTEALAYVMPNLNQETANPAEDISLSESVESLTRLK